jgi:hypothetical protein
VTSSKKYRQGGTSQQSLPASHGNATGKGDKSAKRFTWDASGLLCSHPDREQIFQYVFRDMPAGKN